MIVDNYQRFRSCKADDRNRTENRPLTRRVLCRLSYVGTGGENTRTFGTPAKGPCQEYAGRFAHVGHFAQLSRGIIPKPYLKGKSISAFGARTRRVTGN